MGGARKQQRDSLRAKVNPSRATLILLAGLLLAVFAISACRGAEPGSATLKSVHGGQVVAHDGVTSVVIPPGALTSDIEIRVEPLNSKQLSDMPSATIDILGAATFEPHGLQFAEPVTVTIRLATPLSAGVGLNLIYYDSKMAVYENLGPRARVNDDGLSASALVDHFSTYIVGAQVTNTPGPAPGQGSQDAGVQDAKGEADNFAAVLKAFLFDKKPAAPGAGGGKGSKGGGRFGGRANPSAGGALVNMGIQILEAGDCIYATAIAVAVRQARMEAYKKMANGEKFPGAKLDWLDRMNAWAHNLVARFCEGRNVTVGPMPTPPGQEPAPTVQDPRPILDEPPADTPTDPPSDPKAAPEDEPETGDSGSKGSSDDEIEPGADEGPDPSESEDENQEPCEPCHALLDKLAEAKGKLAGNRDAQDGLEKAIAELKAHLAQLQSRALTGYRNRSDPNHGLLTDKPGEVDSEEWEQIWESSADKKAIATLQEQIEAAEKDLKKLQEDESKLQDEITGLKKQIEDCEQKAKAGFEDCGKPVIETNPPLLPWEPEIESGNNWPPAVDRGDGCGNGQCCEGSSDRGTFECEDVPGKCHDDSPPPCGLEQSRYDCEEPDWAFEWLNLEEELPRQNDSMQVQIKEQFFKATESLGCIEHRQRGGFWEEFSLAPPEPTHQPEPEPEASSKPEPEPAPEPEPEPEAADNPEHAR